MTDEPGLNRLQQSENVTVMDERLGVPAHGVTVADPRGVVPRGNWELLSAVNRDGLAGSQALAAAYHDLIAIFDLAAHFDIRSVANAGLNVDLFDNTLIVDFVKKCRVLTQDKGVTRHRDDTHGFALRQADLYCRSDYPYLFVHFDAHFDQP